ncbi:MAG: efflux RND transporter periplasmic adaptor subunit [Desulfarculaceae bacterium]|nr:efflux RND transporter periplasmic adaptor subunit [Desulfarculaceae bacterium]MCF8046329.1 efflux RND transporter periplasmic adaptor subunit [Desulfarculaceae bacterium]MCF8063699.1 efflux RND transporter periplasmic adaptor subunit [Desulfarculaceae bacterium]MCF8098331.1 efflux RND transporter periplasmic adaptor subunit [Desulfarculaceae bacterium]MCF8121603.1 efflux RND transporter periplasmic adaptor subunit [Desulfarculaceae bacterium]
MGKAKRLKWAVAVVLALALAGGLWAWWPRGGQGLQIQGKEYQVKRGPIRRMIVSTGTVKPQVGAEVKVGARVSGRVEKLLVSIGQAVKAGQVVALIEHKDLEARLLQAQAELNADQARLRRVKATGPREIVRAEAELNEAKATLDLTSLDFNRQQKMRTSDLVAQDALDRAREKHLVAQARLHAATAKLNQVKQSYIQDLKVAEADLAASQARVATAQVTLDYATIKAPISGVVSSVSTQEGETVAASLSAPTFITIVDLARLQVDDFVDETDIGLAKLAQKAFFTVDAYSGRKFMGEVESIQPSAKIVDDVVYYPVTIKILSDYKDLLKPEMTATVSIIAGVRQGVLLIPAPAIRRKGGKAMVYVRRDGKVTLQPVQVGWTEDLRAEITEGLEEGQTVIIPMSAPLTAAKPGGGR